MEPIPNSVLNVLKNNWKPSSDKYSSFESVFNDLEDETRRRDPGYYHIYFGDHIEHDFQVLSYDEAEKLQQEAVFGGLAIKGKNAITINEHARHAFTDFCGDVYAAWEKYLDEKSPRWKKWEYFPNFNVFLILILGAIVATRKVPSEITRLPGRSRQGPPWEIPWACPAAADWRRRPSGNKILNGQRDDKQGGRSSTQGESN